MSEPITAHLHGGPADGDMLALPDPFPPPTISVARPSRIRAMREAPQPLETGEYVRTKHPREQECYMATACYDFSGWRGSASVDAGEKL